MIKKLKKDNIENILGMDKSRIIVFDTETTGLNSTYDELLQVSMIDGNGAALFNSYIRPQRHDSWNEAEAVNHISPEMVRNAPMISEVREEISSLFSNAELLVSYNGGFDTDFLIVGGVLVPEIIPHIDVMREFAPIYGDWNDYFGSYTWKKLIVAAAYYRYDWSSAPHDSLSDCRATLFVFDKICEDIAAAREVEMA